MKIRTHDVIDGTIYPVDPAFGYQVAHDGRRPGLGSLGIAPGALIIEHMRVHWTSSSYEEKLAWGIVVEVVKGMKMGTINLRPIEAQATVLWGEHVSVRMVHY